VVCSTWDLPCVCPPLLGLHTMDTGIRCAVGESCTALSSVLVVDTDLRSPLPAGSVGNVWVSVPSAHSTISRGPTVAPLQWLFDPATKTRSGPYRISGVLLLLLLSRSPRRQPVLDADWLMSFGDVVSALQERHVTAMQASRDILTTGVSLSSAV
jgi:hypothetical protein